MKKMLFVVALVALMVPTTFADGRIYIDGFGAEGDARFNVDTRNDDGNMEVKGENYNWPVSFDFVDAATIPVKMEIGYWMRFNVKNKTMILKQTAIHTYSGSIKIGVETNVNIEVKAKFSPLNDTILAGSENTVKLNDASSIFIGATTSTVDVCVFLELRKVNVKNFQGVSGTGASGSAVGTCIQVGTITLQVRPNVRPNVTGSCGTTGC